MSVPALEARQLSKRYGSLVAIHDVSFAVERGEVVGFLGPNGAGKSTTMRILCGLVPATSGKAYVGGIPVATHPALARRRVGYMPENNPLRDDMRVVEYLRWRAHLKEVPHRHINKRVDEVIEQCDLSRRARRRLIGNLSKGFRQRVGVADVLLGNPEVAIMDEPTIGLDPHQILLMRRLIQSLRGKMTVILSSHILAEVEVSCDRVIILNQGRIVASGRHVELCADFMRETRYELRLLGPLAQLTTVLAQLDPQLHVAATAAPDAEGFQKLVLATPTASDQSEALLRLLLNQPDFRLAGLRRLEAKLEDVFLAATRRAYEETISAPTGQGDERAKAA